LLPRPFDAEAWEDPRAELIRRLQEYEQFKKAAEDLDALPRLERDVFPVAAARPEQRVVKLEPKVELQDILLSFQEVMSRAAMFSHHHIQLEPLSVRERMSNILEGLDSENFTEFVALFTPEEGRLGVVVTLLAILELVKESLIEIIQTETYGPIYVKAPQHVHESTAT
ncbi:MAG: segregation and condensation protein A, partial [Gammaproteobacteria bacterium]